MANKKKKSLPNPDSKFLRISILTLCALGMGLSVYALHVEISKERDSSYTALCDYNELISCSKVFSSRYGRGFGLVDRVLGNDSVINQPNSVFGMAYFTFQTALAFNPSYVGCVVQLFASVIANIGSVYLAFILYYVLEDFCIVCVSTYVVNILVFSCAIIKYKRALAVELHQKKR
ncbi:vitamin K epoxide reductase complex subunit 1 [Patella vulgata]|uniref:vitamin K epoxide reductase complex subunit 1 n=1 Tax=Patella vulgata TaxID=6465 RepID=UPI0021804E0C|nr:vitamin K epoxide reductase complex subunit 1 [Patella vulgata]